MKTLGFDIEFSLYKNCKLIPVVGLIGGTKKEPISFNDYLPASIKNDKYDIFTLKDIKYQEDNVFLEINFPVMVLERNLAETYHNTYSYILYGNVAPINKLLAKKGLKDTLIGFNSYEVFLDKDLRSDQAQLFGCEPDYNCWTNSENPNPGRKTNIRTAGLHIHIGYDNPTIEKSLNYLRVIDLIIGLSITLNNAQGWRKFMYGREGAFRFTDYGFEYRVIPTAMVGHVFQQGFYILLSEIMNNKITINDFSDELIHLIRIANKLGSVTLASSIIRSLGFGVVKDKLMENLNYNETQWISGLYSRLF